jgi:hypothetical protein
MNLHYKIVEVWPQDHLVVIRYWTDALSEEFLASNDIRKEDGTPERCRSDVSVTLPIPAPEGAELEKLLISYAPLDWLKTMEKIQAPEIDTSMDGILNLKHQQFTVADVEKKIPGELANVLTDDEIEAMIQNITANKTE